MLPCLKKNNVFFVALIHRIIELKRYFSLFFPAVRSFVVELWGTLVLQREPPRPPSSELTLNPKSHLPVQLQTMQAAFPEQRVCACTPK